MFGSRCSDRGGLRIYFRLIQTLGSSAHRAGLSARPNRRCIGVLFLGEHLSSTAWVGLGCVVIGVAAMTIPAGGQNRRRRRGASRRDTRRPPPWSGPRPSIPRASRRARHRPVVARIFAALAVALERSRTSSGRARGGHDVDDAEHFRLVRRVTSARSQARQSCLCGRPQAGCGRIMQREILVVAARARGGAGKPGARVTRHGLAGTLDAAWLSVASGLSVIVLGPVRSRHPKLTDTPGFIKLAMQRNRQGELSGWGARVLYLGRLLD